jgi:hypothetical protein
MGAANSFDSHGSSRTVKIIPKGLKSFDQHDADFFLELLPGRRDQDDLPESLRYWKTRIEARDPNDTFQVGLIYGPSGCGKSSLVKAGLLPRLDTNVLPVFIEATPEETPAHLLRGLRKACPGLRDDLGLVESLAVLGRGEGVRSAQKVLLVLDQFEQWLSGRLGEQNADLVAALRHCNGARVGAVIIVRDAFWMAASRFMRELEIDLVPDQNIAGVDLFDLRHARKVLTAFGRAYGTLPEKTNDLSQEQESFLEQAIYGLAQKGKIIPVHLAQFAEVVKGMPWTTATLREVGGIKGIGATFLEETFSSPQANPKYRLQRMAAHFVLRALLPETGTNIKDHMRSETELRYDAGYGDRPRDFDELIHVLDFDLRLITPSDPQSSTGPDAPFRPSGQRYFQLTHDYLIHSLRDWLARKAKYSRGGWVMWRRRRAVEWMLRRMKRIRKNLSELFERGEVSDDGSPVSPRVTLPFIRRHTDVSFPSRVRQGKTYHLRVQIVPAEVVLPWGEISDVPKPHSHDAALTLRAPRPTRSKKLPPLRVGISVAAENFDVAGSPRAQIVVPLEGKSRSVNFRVRGEKVGPGRIMVDFSHGGRPVGSVDIYPEIVAADRGEETRPVPAEAEVEMSLGRGPPAPDLVIKVFEHRFADQVGRLRYIVSSTLGGLRDLPVLDGDFGTIELKTDLVAWVEQRLQSVGSLAHRDDLTAEEVSRALAGVGHALFDQLFPKTLQDLCWTIRGRDVRTILILSDEPHIPWELIKPYRDNPQTGEFEEDEFWGRSYALTRWLRGRPPAQRLSLNRICALAAGAGAPTGGEATITRDMVPPVPAPASIPELSPQVSRFHLMAIGEELAVLRSLEASGSRVRFLPARRREILGVLEQGEFDLLHLIAHGEFAGPGAADTSAVLIEDGEFCVAELSPRMAGSLRRAAPLIFFNSCHSGRIGFSLTRLGSWGAQFVHLGCGGFVGTLWPVTDRAALAFAQAFYHWMRLGLPIGEVMLRARQGVRERYPNDPTWLAYCCFADPMARIGRVVTQRAEASVKL